MSGEEKKLNFDLKTLEKEVKKIQESDMDFQTMLRLEKEVDEAAAQMLLQAGLLEEEIAVLQNAEDASLAFVSSLEGPEEESNEELEEDDDAYYRRGNRSQSGSPNTHQNTYGRSPPRSGTAELPDDLKHSNQQGIVQALFEERKFLADESKKLFQIHQEFQKRLQDSKELRNRNIQRRKDYVDKMVVYALRDSELRYQKEQLLRAEETWSGILEEDKMNVEQCRQELESLLKQYRNTRKNIASFQERSSKLTEEGSRIATLNSVAFYHYAKSVIECELKKIPNNNSQPVSEGNRPKSGKRGLEALPNRRILAKHQSEFTDKLDLVRKQLYKFYQEKILDFRRQERILLGRSREMSEFAAGGLGNTSASSPKIPGVGSPIKRPGNDDGGSSSMGTNTDILHQDSYENRVAQRMFATLLDSHANSHDNFGNAMGDSDDDIEDLLKSFLRKPPAGGSSSATASRTTIGNSTTKGRKGPSETGDKDKLHLPRLTTVTGTADVGGKAHTKKRGSFSAAKDNDTPIGATAGEGFFQDKQGTQGRPFSTRSPTKTPSEANNGIRVKDYTGYNTEKFLKACAPDFIRPHTLLDVNRGMGDREEQLYSLSSAYCQAKGEVARLAAIRDVRISSFVSQTLFYCVL